MGYVDKATMALIKSGIFPTWNYQDGSKMVDVTHADVDEHTLSPADLGLPDNVVAVLTYFWRISGSGFFQIRTKPAGGSAAVLAEKATVLWPIGSGGDFIYRLTFSGDDWDLHGLGYLTEGRLLG